MTHVAWWMPGSLTCGFIGSRQRGKSSRHSRRMQNPQFCVCGKRPMEMSSLTASQAIFPMTLPDLPYWGVIPSYGFGGYVYKAVEADWDHECGRNCGQDERCRSANWRNRYPLRKECELNSKAFGDDTHAFNLTYIGFRVSYYYYCIIDGRYIRFRPEIVEAPVLLN